MKKNIYAEIISKEYLLGDVVLITIKDQSLTINSTPGQFIHIKCGNNTNTILRRPISIFDTDKKAETLSFIFQVRGKGTKYLAEREVGEVLDILGPLGSSFDLSNRGNVMAVGGGIGAFPLHFLLKNIEADKKRIVLGYSNIDSIVLEETFKDVTEGNLHISTDDGSCGYKGFCTDLFQEQIEKDRPDMVYTCGPEIMMKKVARTCKELGIPCEVSLEERMGCGVGACLVCACEIKDKNGNASFKHVCKDGPVFKGERWI